MVGHVIEIEHRLRRVSRAVYGALWLVLRVEESSLSARLRVVSLNRTYLQPCGTTDD